MAEIELIKITISLISKYDGNEKDLKSVVSNLNVLKKIVKPENKETIIELVLGRLTGRARIVVGETPTSIEDIVSKLQDRCSIKLTPEIVVSNMDNTKQTGTIEDFGSVIEKLTQQLEEAYIAEDITPEVARKKATKSGISALSYGLKDGETKIIMRSSKFETLHEAINEGVACTCTCYTVYNQFTRNSHHT